MNPGMLFKQMVLVIVLGLVWGCARSPIKISMMDSQALRSVADLDLCHAYRVGTRIGTSTRDIAPEINRRGLLTVEEWNYVRREKIRKGMSLCGLYAAWGAPESLGPVNRPHEGGSIQTQHLYRKHSRARPTYVYTENGKIVGWRD